MTKLEARQQIIEALATQGIEAIYGKGGFWLRDQGFKTFAQARKIAGVEAEYIERQARATPYGDYATIAALSGRLNG